MCFCFLLGITVVFLFFQTFVYKIYTKCAVDMQFETYGPQTPSTTLSKSKERKQSKKRILGRLNEAYGNNVLNLLMLHFSAWFSRLSLAWQEDRNLNGRVYQRTNGQHKSSGTTEGDAGVGPAVVKFGETLQNWKFLVKFISF